jgi:membrane-bound lytic murein transglycosylase D
MVGNLLAAVCLLAGAPGCAGPEPAASLPKAPLADASPGLVPREFVCPPGQPAEAVDPQLVKEIKVFFEKNGMLAGAPAGVASDLPVVLNGPVQNYLRYFTTSGKATFQASLHRARRYLPMIHQVFRQQGLPLDLAYLALVESGFSNTAVSPAQAVGMWQFIAGTARRYGLRVDDQVDERRDPDKATRAAARYLKDLYQQFGCWYLAAAGYNAGEGRVEGVVRRRDTRDFWTMAQQKWLPQETCNYVPQLIAAALIAKNPARYGFSPAAPEPAAWARVRLKAGTDLNRFAALADISLATIQDLNPELTALRLPATPPEYLLRIPAGKQQAALRAARACASASGPEAAE